LHCSKVRASTAAVESHLEKKLWYEEKRDYFSDLQMWQMGTCSNLSHRCRTKGVEVWPRLESTDRGALQVAKRSLQKGNISSPLLGTGYSSFEFGGEVDAGGMQAPFDVAVVHLLGFILEHSVHSPVKWNSGRDDSIRNNKCMIVACIMIHTKAATSEVLTILQRVG
jgi:hypothetical protein